MRLRQAPASFDALQQSKHQHHRKPSSAKGPLQRVSFSLLDRSLCMRSCSLRRLSLHIFHTRQLLCASVNPLLELGSTDITASSATRAPPPCHPRLPCPAPTSAQHTSRTISCIFMNGRCCIHTTVASRSLCQNGNFHTSNAASEHIKCHQLSPPSTVPQWHQTTEKCGKSTAAGK